MNSRKLAGILTIAFGQAYLIYALIAGIAYFWPNLSANDIINLVFISLTILGGAMGIAGKKSGGTITLIAGLFIVFFGILFTIDTIYFYHNPNFMNLQPVQFINILFNITGIPMKIPVEAIGFVIFGLLMLRGQKNG